jgi:hypothetical protein
MTASAGRPPVPMGVAGSSDQSRARNLLRHLGPPGLAIEAAGGYQRVTKSAVQTQACAWPRKRPQLRPMPAQW